MDVKEYLEKQARSCTRFPECRRQRAVICIWDAEDVKAAAFCERLEKESCGKADFICVKEGESAEAALSGVLQVYREKIVRSEIACPCGLYILTVGTSHELCSELGRALDGNSAEVYFDVWTMEFCRLAKVRGRQGDYPAIASGTEWRVYECDVLPVALLLLNASYGSRLLGEEFSDGCNGRCFWLEAKEYSSVREAMSRRLLASLRRQLEASENVEKAAKRCLSMEPYESAVFMACPRPDYLPVLNGEDFPEKISFFHYLPGRRDFGSGREMTLGCVLERMFGIEEDRSRPEWLRRYVEREAMGNICKEILEKNRKLILEQAGKRFSLYDIRSVLPAVVSGFREVPRREMENLEHQIDMILGRRIRMPLKIEEAFMELGDYFALWEKWLRACAAYQWWENMAVFVRLAGVETEGDYNEFLAAKDTLENLCWKDPYPGLGRRQAETVHEVLNPSSLKELFRMCEADGDWNLARFSATDLQELMEEADKRYTETDYFHVDDRQQPVICLWHNEAVGPVKKPEGLHFHWKLRPVSFLPEAILYELVIWDDLTERF